MEWANAIDASRTVRAPRGSAAPNPAGFTSLGDLDAAQIAAGVGPGRLTVTFPSGVRDGAGADFAVFENGFEFGPAGSLFAELAYVEVSTNGTDFVRFASISTNTGPSAGGAPFAAFDMTNVYNLAGKHADGFGTPFDLSELAGRAEVVAGLVDLSDIRFVRLVDVVGNGSALDSLGNPIRDNWLTSAPTGGFDFRLGVGTGVGVLNAVPAPGAAVCVLMGAALAAWRRRVGRGDGVSR